MHALAEKMGGERGERMRAAVQKPLFKDLKQMDEPISDAAFAAQLTKLASDFERAFDRVGRGASDKPGSWGLPN